MLSQTVEYALRAVVCLARAVPHPLTNEQLAQQTRVPSAYLPKVTLNLRKAGLIAAQRGPRGGLRLARPVDSITLLEVVNAVDPIRRIHQCPLGLKSHAGQLCALHRQLDEIVAQAERTYGETTLADVLRYAEDGRPLCEPAASFVLSLQ
jgi:Rrf2 family protein